ncbi:MAG TPA: excinuclease ABC subunit UvrC [Candidatus Aminicenantes bacterium]|nr:excinuclease ABC subunit UvrC [Candidatus Aminicenantes bacterium]
MIDPSRLPHLPGCYIFRNSHGQPLYIGKARDLRQRVSNYFHSRNHGPRIRRMLDLARDVDAIVTHNEVEAFLLENTLIKKHQPRFNVDLKDAKTYAWLHITAETFPRIVTARRVQAGGEFFGPYVSGTARNEIRTTLNNIFGLRTCKRLPKRACLRKQMGTCCAPCAGEVSADDYAQRVRDARQVLKGRIRQLIPRLEARMNKAAAGMQYESALQLRNRIHSLQHTLERQQVQTARPHQADIIHSLTREGQTLIMRFGVRNGVLEGKEEFVFEAGDDAPEEFLSRYYASQPVPREIILSEDPGPGMREWLSRQRGGRVTVTVPQRGNKRRLLELVQLNLETTYFSGPDSLKELEELLGLDRPPLIMECFDISHLQGSDMVASMVRFRDGRPEPGAYRRFRIRNVSGINDPAAMDEVVTRRYSRLLREGSDLPDLVVVDGGLPQRNIAERAVQKLDLDLAVIALAKREESVYVPSRKSPLLLDHRRPALRLLQRLRDESHRFALAYHRRLRNQKMRS